MKILLVRWNDTQTDVMSLGLETMIPGAEVINASDPQEAARTLESADGFSCIVSEDKFPDGSDCLPLYEKRNANRPQCPFVLITASDPANLPVFAANRPQGVVKRPIDLSELIKEIQRATRKKPSGEEEQYVKVPIRSLLLLGSHLEMDLFLKVSEGKFVQVEKAGETFGAADFKKYHEKNVHHLHVVRTEFAKKMSGWLKELQDSLSAEKSAGLDNTLQRLNESHAMVGRALTFQEFTPELQKVTDASVRLAVKAIQADSSLSEMLKGKDYSEIPYIQAHSTTLALVACRVATIMGWASDSTFYKLSLSAFLHDLSLEEDMWAKLETEYEVTRCGLSKEVQEKILNHPLQASEMVRAAADLPGDVSFIVAQHHELPDGSGFPRRLTTKEISALSAAFIVAHDLTKHIMGKGDNWSLEEYLDDPSVKSRFDRGSTGLVLRNLRSRIVEKSLTF